MTTQDVDLMFGAGAGLGLVGLIQMFFPVPGVAVMLLGSGLMFLAAYARNRVTS